MGVFDYLEGVATFQMSPSEGQDVPAWACIGDPYNALEGAKKFLQLQLQLLTNPSSAQPSEGHCWGVDGVELLLPVEPGTWKAALLAPFDSTEGASVPCGAAFWHAGAVGSSVTDVLPLLLDMEERVGAFDSEAVATSSTADIRCVGLRDWGTHRGLAVREDFADLFPGAMFFFANPPMYRAKAWPVLQKAADPSGGSPLQAGLAVLGRQGVAVCLPGDPGMVGRVLFPKDGPRRAKAFVMVSSEAPAYIAHLRLADQPVWPWGFHSSPAELAPLPDEELALALSSLPSPSLRHLLERWVDAGDTTLRRLLAVADALQLRPTVIDPGLLLKALTAGPLVLEGLLDLCTALGRRAVLLADAAPLLVPRLLDTLDVSALRILLQAGLSPNVPSSEPFGPVRVTPLAHAALLGHGAAVHELLEHSADPNETVEPLRWPPVACAAWGLSPECVATLLPLTGPHLLSGAPPVPLDWERAVEYCQASTRVLFRDASAPPPSEGLAAVDLSDVPHGTLADIAVYRFVVGYGAFVDRSRQSLEDAARSAMPDNGMVVNAEGWSVATPIPYTTVAAPLAAALEDRRVRALAVVAQLAAAGIPIACAEEEVLRWAKEAEHTVAPPDADDDDGDAAAEDFPPIDLRGIAAAFWDEASRSQ